VTRVGVSGTLRFVNPLPLVADMAVSRVFYRDVLGLGMLRDAESFVQFEGGFALHDGAAMLRMVLDEPRKETGAFGRDNLVLYFSTDDIDAAFARIAPQVVLIHPVRMQAWGERLFRFRDPDGHIVEVGDAGATTAEGNSDPVRALG
jgi:catechol 2,3-dioxygenase-like lactoylglutathione lyase family enzyme